jgi:hypothetical protein
VTAFAAVGRSVLMERNTGRADEQCRILAGNPEKPVLVVHSCIFHSMADSTPLNAACGVAMVMRIRLGSRSRVSRPFFRIVGPRLAKNAH